MACTQELCDNTSSTNCNQTFYETGGLVGRTPDFEGSYGGYWYSFQALSECAAHQNVGDGGCKWKVIGVERVPVCCVDLASNETFVSSFEECPHAAQDIASYVCPTMLTTLTTTTRTTTAAGHIAHTTAHAPTFSPTFVATSPPSTSAPSTTSHPTSAMQPPASTGGSGSKVKLSVGEDVGVSIGAAQCCGGDPSRRSHLSSRGSICVRLPPGTAGT
jgi:hypothetical protein